MRLVLIDPGHFHAALLLREMYAGVDPRVEVFAPVGPEAIDFLSRVTAFNQWTQNPTRWDVDLHLTAAPLGRMDELLRGKSGDVAILTGRNRPKIDRILAALRAGMHVLADKPWIIDSADLPNLQEALDLADRGGLIAYDIMTERYEVTSQLQREFVSDREFFGEVESVTARSVHNIMKMVAGTPLRRPPWFFDIEEYGEALADVGTHVVDLVEWTAFAPRPLDATADVCLIAGRRWPLRITAEQFEQVTGVAPAADLDYYCNNWVHYTWRGVEVQLEIVWNWEAAPGAGDVYEASFHGTRGRAEIRQGASEKHIPELYLAGISEAALLAKIEQLRTRWPGLSLVASGGEWRIAIPPQFRVGHEVHFAQVANQFFQYVRAPETFPAWERPNMLAKYAVTTGGVDLGRRS